MSDDLSTPLQKVTEGDVCSKGMLNVAPKVTGVHQRVQVETDTQEQRGMLNVAPKVPVVQQPVQAQADTLPQGQAAVQSDLLPKK